MFKVGDKVEWGDGSPGWASNPIKTGVVVAVVPQEGLPRRYLKGEALTHKCLFDRFAPTIRNHESYLIEVPGNTPKAKPKLYWPRVSQLRKVED